MLTAARDRVSFLSIFLKTNIRSDELYNTDGIPEEDPLVPRAPFALAIAESYVFVELDSCFSLPLPAPLPRACLFFLPRRRYPSDPSRRSITKMGRRYSL